MSTTTLAAPVVLAEPAPEPATRPRWLLTLLSAAVGIVIVGFSFRLAAQGDSAQLYYATFWLGMLLAILPAGALVFAERTSVRGRLGAVVLVSLLTAVPKYLRNPTVPLYHDEYAHWRQTLDVLDTDQLFRPNQLIPIVQYFPGTSALTTAIQRISGLSIWSSGQLLVLAVHCLSMLAVYVLVTSQLRSERAGGIAALIYGLNASAVYFDTQFAYESVAIGLFLWTLALGSLAAHSTSVRLRWRLTIAALLCAAACVVTHHLTTLAMLGVLGGLAVFVAARRRPDNPDLPDGRAVWWTLFGGTAVVAGLWLAFIAWPTISYLSPYVGGSVTQLGTIGSGGGGGRQLLAANAQPSWERLFTAMSPVVAAVVCWRGLLIIRSRKGMWSAATLGLVAFGLIYFPSVPFVLAPSGAEGARRSWAFSYVGVALIFALVATTRRQLAPGSGRRSSGGRWAGRSIPARWTTPIELLVLAIVLVGNVGGGLNDPYRFPGKFLWGSDTRSFSPEAKTVAQLLSAQTGTVRVVTDRYTALPLIDYGGLDVATPDPGFPVWLLFESTTTPDQRLIDEMVTSDYEYLVVDTRMYTDQAFNGNNFGPADPEGAGPVPAEDLHYLESAPWATQVLTTEHLRVFKLDFAHVGDVIKDTP